MINLALYHPQIPQNAGTLLRLGSCLGIFIDIIRPIGFICEDKRLRRAGMDYIPTSNYTVYNSFDIFHAFYEKRRLIALDVGENSVPYHTFEYLSDDILVVGSEHYGFLEQDLEKMQHRVKIPMLPQRRSLNMAIAASIVVGEAMKQLNLY
ncbi:MAG: tRNA methyltransferase [Holosporaceae bacterium]|jgi:tRNA (cytidine/uridine-2'-O-)-methyltransferase|nr:tRNA methyltransferase [Holosporaceae bacterium]